MKAILVLDKMPERCGDCPLLQQMYDDEYEKWFDMCFWRQCEIKETEGKLKDCPLKPFQVKPLQVSNKFDEDDEQCRNCKYICWCFTCSTHHCMLAKYLGGDGICKYEPREVEDESNTNN